MSLYRPLRRALAKWGLVDAQLEPAEPQGRQVGPHMTKATLGFELPELLGGDRRIDLDRGLAMASSAFRPRLAGIFLRRGPSWRSLPETAASRTPATAGWIGRGEREWSQVN
jgi:hypothetical protein